MYLGSVIGVLFLHHPDTARIFFGSGNMNIVMIVYMCAYMCVRMCVCVRLCVCVSLSVCVSVCMHVMDYCEISINMQASVFFLLLL